MKTYHGERAAGTTDPGPVTVTVDGETYPLKPQWSWTGFSWGYYGSGPGHLAFALLVDATGDRDLAVAHYQSFKELVISQLPDIWDLPDAVVLDCAYQAARIAKAAAARGRKESKQP